MNNYELAKIDYSNGMSTKEIAEKYNVSVATVRKWKSRHNWDSVTKKRDKNVTSKKAKEVAKILIEEGVSISDAAKQTETPRGTIGRWSSEENLQQSQLEYLKEFRESNRKRIRENKLKRLCLIEEALMQIESEIFNGECTKNTLEKLKISEEIEQLLFKENKFYDLELTKRKLEIEEEKLEIEKQKLKTLEKNRDKTGNFLDKLEEFL